MKRSRSPLNIATHGSYKAKPCELSRPSAIFSGTCSTPFIRLMESIADNAQPKLSRGVRLQIDCTTGKGVLLFPEGILELNETAQEILTRCDGRTVGAIVADLAQEYDVDPAALATDVWETLNDLRHRKLVEIE